MVAVAPIQFLCWNNFRDYTMHHKICSSPVKCSLTHTHTECRDSINLVQSFVMAGLGWRSLVVHFVQHLNFFPSFSTSQNVKRWDEDNDVDRQRVYKRKREQREKTIFIHNVLLFHSEMLKLKADSFGLVGVSIFDVLLLLQRNAFQSGFFFPLFRLLLSGSFWWWKMKKALNMFSNP